MSRYRRLKIEGGAFFFTLAVAERGSDLLVRHIERLRRAYAEMEKRRPFETVAICILPDHIHALWQLPDGDTDYAARWSLFKSGFSRGLPPDGNALRQQNSQAGKRHLAAPLLGACDPRRLGLRTARQLRPLQSREAWARDARRRLAVQQFSPLCCGGHIAARLGW